MTLWPARLSLLLVICFAFAASAIAQEARSVNLPNPMTIHTWFIIAAVGAFLAWSISYAIQAQKEAVRRQKDRSDVVRQKDELLDRIADLEARKEAGKVADPKYRHEMKELRFRLAKTLEKAAAPPLQEKTKLPS
jgi:hypothetical protein